MTPPQKRLRRRRCSLRAREPDSDGSGAAASGCPALAGPGRAPGRPAGPPATGLGPARQRPRGRHHLTSSFIATENWLRREKPRHRDSSFFERLG